MNEFRQPSFHFYDGRSVCRGKVARPFKLKSTLSSFHTYEAVTKYIMKRASRMGLTKTQLSDFEKSLSEIASSLERLKIDVGNCSHPGNKKTALCLISEIAFCYKDPVQAIGSLNASYALIVRMADNVREGRLKPVPENFEKRVAECKAAAKFLCSVSGLRQLRREVAECGEPRNSTCPLPVISNQSLSFYVDIGPSLINGRSVSTWRPIPINPPDEEEKGKYINTVQIILKNFALADRFNSAWTSVALEDIVDSLSAIPFGLDKRRVLCLIAETCLTYKDPSRILDGFRMSYAALKEIAETIDADRKYPISPGKERQAEDFARRARMFSSIQGLTRIRTNAALSMNGSGSTYEIGFVSQQELRDISYGKGPELELR